MKKQNVFADIEECARKIKNILQEYNCALYTTEEYCWIFLKDLDTDERCGEDGFNNLLID